MSVLHAPQDNNTILKTIKLFSLSQNEKPWMLTPFIITLCDTKVTALDIQNFIEAGHNIFRFKIHLPISEKRELILMLRTAISMCCEKNGVSTLPIALSIDIPNACVKTGFTFKDTQVYIKEDTIVEVTSDDKYCNMCTAKRVYIDDPYILEAIKLGTEVTICFGEIVMICTEVVDSKTIHCKVVRGGMMGSQKYVCIRGVKHLKPPLTKNDLDLIDFAKEFKADIVIINSIRYSSTVKRIRALFPHDETPLIVSTICEQEGLDNIDDIIKESDGIILAREFIAYEIQNINLMTAIQINMGGKCRKQGKPFYISGNILEISLQNDTLACCDLNDITNAVLQGAGFVLRAYNDPAVLTRVMTTMTSVCKAVEPLMKSEDIWRMSMEFKMPVNAAEAAVLGTALLAKQTGSFVIILPTVTGRTAKQLALIAPEAIIITVSSNPRIARQLQLYRGIIAVIYDEQTMKNWFDEIDARIKFAVAFGLRHDILNFGHTYVALRKALPTSSFADHISIWKVASDVKKETVCQYPVDRYWKNFTFCLFLQMPRMEEELSVRYDIYLSDSSSRVLIFKKCTSYHDNKLLFTIIT